MTTDVALLSVSDLCVRYGRAVKALNGVSLDVPRGAVVCVLGNNGAGKSTLLRAISGTYRLHGGTVESGTVTLDGRDVTRSTAAHMVTNGVVQVPEGRKIFGRLTVEENLRAGGIRNKDRKAKNALRDHVFELFPMLADKRRQRGALLSGGQQQMLAIGRALMAQPRLLLLDEPSLGLAPQVVEQIGGVVKEINAAGTAVLIIEQNAEIALALAHQAYVLELGAVSLSGVADELRGSEEIQRLYLGGGAPDAEQPGTPRARPVLSRWNA